MRPIQLLGDMVLGFGHDTIAEPASDETRLLEVNTANLEQAIADLVAQGLTREQAVKRVREVLEQGVCE